MDKIIKSINYDYIEYKKAIKRLCERYDFLIPEVIGRSVGGRDITALKIGRAQSYALLCAAVHGSEHITTNLLLIYLENLCESIKSGLALGGFNMQGLLGSRGVIFVPLVNPDGAEISIHGESSAGLMRSFVARHTKGNHSTWNANLRGVDINHNFDADFDEVKKAERAAGIYLPCASRYGGSKPFSEPESIALKGLCEAYPIRHALAFHSQGEVIFADSENPSSKLRRMGEILSTASGYALSEPSGTAKGGGFKDWFIKRFSRPAFTVEVGLGKNPLPINTDREIYSRLEEMLILSTVM